MTREEILDRLARANLTPLGVRSLAAFGSVARGKASASSDTDLLAEFDGPTIFHAHIELEHSLEVPLDAPVDPVTRPSLPAPLRRSIPKDVRYVSGPPYLRGCSPSLL